MRGSPLVAVVTLAALGAVGIGLAGAVAPAPAAAEQQHRSYLRVGASANAKQIKLGLNKATIIELPPPAREIVVPNPEKLDAVLQTATRAHLIGKQVGEANVAMRAYDDVRKALRETGVRAAAVTLEPYFANGDPTAPMRLSYLQFVAEPPDCPDWSENIGRDPKNMPWPNMGCAGQRNLAAMVANPEDLLHPRGETPRSGERRDTVWGNYVRGQVTGSDWAPDKKPLSEHATSSDVILQGGN